MEVCSFNPYLCTRSISASKVTDSRPESGEANSSSNFFLQAESFLIGTSGIELLDLRVSSSSS